VKRGPTIAICVLVLALLWPWVALVGWGGELVGLALVVAAAPGVQIGLRTRARVPTWVAPVLAAGGIAFLLVALSQYNDDGPSGRLFGWLFYIGLSAIPATALAAGMSVGSHLRRRRDAGVNR
jgi:peptidoglycan/LPS O-acetylase OafA/YrhL